ncbi:MAG TPA: PQQ-binding-like beta-propeller repeat protein [Elusimicrobiota bacterium]|nr:PQQ-binding-like beta-propeller repeat protein [Elusimicrobiota bacterium]
MLRVVPNHSMRRTIAAGCLLFLSSPPVWGADWPGFKRDTAKTSYAREQAYPADVGAPLTEAWSYNHIPGQVRSSPIVAGGKVFFGSRDNSVWAFDAETGAIVWQYSTDDWVDATPAAAEGKIYVPSRDGKLYAFDQNDGSTPLWTFSSGGKDMSSPVILNNRIYWTSGYPQTRIVCVSAVTGELLWQQGLGNNSASSPVIEGNAVIAGANNGIISAFSLTDGTPLWAYQTSGNIFYSSLAGDGQGYVYGVAGGDDPKLYAFRVSDGSLKTGYPVSLVDLSPIPGVGKPASETSSVAIAGDRLYVCMTGVDGGSVKLKIYCRNLSDGGPVWSQEIGNTPEGLGYASTPAVANDVVYVGSGDKKLYLFKAADGTSLGTLTLDHKIVSSPAVSNGKIFIATLGGSIYALTARKAAAIASPAEMSIVGGIVPVTGLTVNPDFQNYKVSYGAGTSPSGWTQIGATHESPVTTLGTLESWDTTNLSPGLYTLRLAVSDAAVNAPDSTSHVTVRIDPSYVRQHVNASQEAVLAGADGTRLVIPAAGLNQNDYVTLQRPSASPGDKAPDGTASTGILRQFEFDSPQTKLLKQATLTIPYDEMTVASMSAGALRLFLWNGSQWTLVADSSSDTAARTVSGRVSSAGIYQIMEYRVADTNADYVYISPDGAEIHISSGSLSRADSVTVLKHTSGDIFNKKTPVNTSAMPEIWEFKTGQADTVFLKPVTIKIPYNPSNLPAGIPEARLRIYLWYPDLGVWKIVNGSRVDMEKKKVSLQVSHFSNYRIMAFLSVGPLLEKNKVYTYPNPAKGETVTFKTYLGDDADIVIDVFNVAGEKVVQLNNTGTAGNVIETTWDIRDVASGIYIYRVEAKTPAGGKANVTKKLAILH